MRFRAATRNRTVERIVKYCHSELDSESHRVGLMQGTKLILKPSILVGDSGSEAGVTLFCFCHPELDSGSHSWTFCKELNNFNPF